MRNVLLALAAAGFIYFCYVVMSDWYTGVEANLEGRNRRKEEEQKNVAGVETPSGGRTSTTTSPDKPTASSSSTPKTILVVPRAVVTKTNKPNVVICTRDVDAYNPTNSLQLIGKFHKDTQLTIGSKDVLSGKYYVFYDQPNGKKITALCKAEDLGK
jgi:hypothetical protein